MSSNREEVALVIRNPSRWMRFASQVDRGPVKAVALIAVGMLVGVLGPRLLEARPVDTLTIFHDGAVARAEEVNANFAELKAAIDDNYDLIIQAHPTLFASAKSLLFDGVDDAVRVNSSTSLNATDAVTWMAWIKTTAATGTIMSQWDSTVSNGMRFNFEIASGGRLQITVSDNGTFTGHVERMIIGTGGALNNGTWHHVAATFDHGTLKLFFDGAHVPATPNIDNPITALHVSPYELLIGAVRTGSTRALPFAGGIDEPAVINAVLAASDLQAIHAAGPGSLGNYRPAAWWRMGDQTDTSLTTFDRSGRVNDGTILGATVQVDAP